MGEFIKYEVSYKDFYVQITFSPTFKEAYIDVTHPSYCKDEGYGFILSNKETKRLPNFSRFPYEVRKLIFTGLWLLQQCPSYPLRYDLWVPCFLKADNVKISWVPNNWFLERN